MVWWPRRPGLHGDARFATEREMSDANLFGSKGIVLGRVGRRLVRLPVAHQVAKCSQLSITGS
jgi:type IV secretion system protein VirD4